MQQPFTVVVVVVDACAVISPLNEMVIEGRSDFWMVMF